MDISFKPKWNQRQQMIRLSITDMDISEAVLQRSSSKVTLLKPHFGMGVIV